MIEHPAPVMEKGGPLSRTARGEELRMVNFVIQSLLL